MGKLKTSSELLAAASYALDDGLSRGAKPLTSDLQKLAAKVHGELFETIDFKTITDPKHKDLIRFTLQHAIEIRDIEQELASPTSDKKALQEAHKKAAEAFKAQKQLLQKAKIPGVTLKDEFKVGQQNIPVGVRQQGTSNASSRSEAPMKAKTTDESITKAASMLAGYHPSMDENLAGPSTEVKQSFFKTMTKLSLDDRQAIYSQAKSILNSVGIQDPRFVDTLVKAHDPEAVSSAPTFTKINTTPPVKKQTHKTTDLSVILSAELCDIYNEDRENTKQELRGKFLEKMKGTSLNQRNKIFDLTRQALKNDDETETNINTFISSIEEDVKLKFLSMVPPTINNPRLGEFLKKRLEDPRTHNPTNSPLSSRSSMLSSSRSFTDQDLESATTPSSRTESSILSPSTSLSSSSTTSISSTSSQSTDLQDTQKLFEAKALTEEEREFLGNNQDTKEVKLFIDAFKNRSDPDMVDGWVREQKDAFYASEQDTKKGLNLIQFIAAQRERELELTNPEPTKPTPTPTATTGLVATDPGQMKKIDEAHTAYQASTKGTDDYAALRDAVKSNSVAIEQKTAGEYEIKNKAGTKIGAIQMVASVSGKGEAVPSLNPVDISGNISKISVMRQGVDADGKILTDPEIAICAKYEKGSDGKFTCTSFALPEGHGLKLIGKDGTEVSLTSLRGASADPTKQSQGLSSEDIQKYIQDNPAAALQDLKIVCTHPKTGKDLTLCTAEEFATNMKSMEQAKGLSTPVPTPPITPIPTPPTPIPAKVTPTLIKLKVSANLLEDHPQFKKAREEAEAKSTAKQTIPAPVPTSPVTPAIAPTTPPLKQTPTPVTPSITTPQKVDTAIELKEELEKLRQDTNLSGEQIQEFAKKLDEQKRVIVIAGERIDPKKINLATPRTLQNLTEKLKGALEHQVGLGFPTVQHTGLNGVSQKPNPAHQKAGNHSWGK